MIQSAHGSLLFFLVGWLVGSAWSNTRLLSTPLYMRLRKGSRCAAVEVQSKEDSLPPEKTQKQKQKMSVNEEAHMGHKLAFFGDLFGAYHNELWGDWWGFRMFLTSQKLSCFEVESVGNLGEPEPLAWRSSFPNGWNPVVEKNLAKRNALKRSSLPTTIICTNLKGHCKIPLATVKAVVVARTSGKQLQEGARRTNLPTTPKHALQHHSFKNKQNKTSTTTPIKVFQTNPPKISFPTDLSEPLDTTKPLLLSSFWSCPTSLGAWT